VTSVKPRADGNPIGRDLTERGYDLAALLFVLVFFVLLFRIRAYLPIFSDSWYHLSVIRGFAENGFSLRAWWEFAPFGRPHLYSQLFHIVGVGILGVTGLSLTNLATLYDIVTFPLLLSAGWLAARCLFGTRAAFVTLLLLSLNIGLLFPCSLIMMPWTYALILWPFVHVLALRKRWIGAGLLLSVMWYLHFGVASVAAVSLLVLALFRREDWKPILATVATTCVSFSPWLIHLYCHREFLHVGEARLPVFIPGFTIVAAILAVRATVRQPTKESLAMTAAALACALFLFTLRERFWTYGGFLLAIFGGHGIERCTPRQMKLMMIVLLVSCVSVTPFLKPPRMKLALPVPFQSTPGHMATPFLALLQWQRADKAIEVSEAMPADVFVLADWITSNVKADEIIITDDRLLGGCVFALTGRKTTSGLWGETMTNDLTDKLAEYRRNATGYLILGADKSLARESPSKVIPIATFGRYSVYYRQPA